MDKISNGEIKTDINANGKIPIRESKSVSFQAEPEWIGKSSEDLSEEDNTVVGDTRTSNILQNGTAVKNESLINCNSEQKDVDFLNNVNLCRSKSTDNSYNGINLKYNSISKDPLIKTDGSSEENETFLPLTKVKIKKMSHMPERKSIELGFSGLNYTVSNGKKGLKTILKSIDGKFKPGHLNGILGPSGAGKSTLMNILAGYRTSRVSGEILVNGQPRSLRRFRKQSCYIMQEDHLLQFLTVQESMDVASILKLGNTVSLSSKEELITEILDNLSLKDSRATRVANLSGGEKKRLSIAMELVNNPPVMFFDEPTSGLDSQNSYQCISLLKGLAEGGRTIICTIHQPSARLFEKFDTLYALAEGQCIFKGPVNDLVPFLSSLALECPSYHNPADFLVEIASGEYGDFITKLVGAVNCGFINDKRECDTKRALKLDLVANQKNSSEIENEVEWKGDCIYSPKEESIKLDLTSCEHKFLPKDDNEVFDYPSSFWTQFYVLFIRTFKSIVRDAMLTKLRFLAHVSVGVIIGVLFLQIGNEASEVLSNIGCLFFSLMFLLFTAMMPTIVTFPLEMNVFVREHLNYWYSTKAYYLAKTMADLPFQILFSIIYVVIVYFLTNQPLDIERFLLFNLICIMTSLVAQSIGLTIGAAFDMSHSVFLGPALAIPALLFSGFFATFSTIPVYMRWITYFSYIRYGYEASVLAIYGGGRENLHCSESFCLFKHPKKILEQVDMVESKLWFCVMMLGIFFVVIRTLGYFILKWKLRRLQ